ncbi:MAG: FAD-dependent monooxygenase [Deltaproteobacteria bacterium]|nr:FAD-dependent monooxygenase [Deltaproteobacteria bacterium]
MEVEGLDVIVVGGATGGAGAALLLARAGARVRLIERVAEPRAVGAGIAIADNGLAVLESLGLGPALARASRELAAPAIVDARDRVLFAPPEPRPRIVMARRSTLQALLLDALAGEPRVERRFGVEVVGASRDGVVVIEGRGGREELTADLVIGADGVHSRVRAAGDFASRERRPGITYLRALVPGDVATGVEAWTSAGLFGAFPVDGGTYLYASVGSRATQRAVAARDLSALAAAWARAYPPSAACWSRVARWEDVLVNRVLRVDCRRWHDGRLALLGDAAHAMAPNLGQGANSALVDGAVLLDELRRHATIAQALAAYQARRQPAVRRVADLAGRLGRLAELSNPVARLLRDRLLMPLARLTSSPSQGRLVMQEPPATLLAIGRA